MHTRNTNDRRGAWLAAVVPLAIALALTLVAPARPHGVSRMASPVYQPAPRRIGRLRPTWGP